MKTIYTTLLLIFVVLATQACGKAEAPHPEEACYFQQNGYLQRVSWRTTPVVMHADSSLTPERVEALKDAMEIWNAALLKQRNGKVTFAFGQVLNGQVGLQNDYMNVVSLSQAFAPGSREQAETLLMWEGSSILEADIRLNAQKDQHFYVGDSPKGDDIDLVALYVHELGHVLGLVHIEDVPEYTTMAVSLDRGADGLERRQIGAVELNALKCEY